MTQHRAVLARGSPAFSPRGRGAFTLVELLVVIGIIALLVAMLLPSLSKAREQAKQVQCLSNMRQLGLAFVNYTNENKGIFPAPAASPHADDDWLYWEAGLDPTDGAIQRYLGPIFNPESYRCPSDTMESHANAGYLYSYTVNWMICDYAARAAHTSPIPITRIRNPSDKILVIDESSDTMDDGCWAPQHYFTDGKNLMSNRHERQFENSGDQNAGRGNAGFVDGHAEFIPRADSLLDIHYDPFK